MYASGTNCSWPKWKRKWKLYPKKSVIQMKVSNSALNTMRAHFSEWVCVCVLHIYSVIFTPPKESKTCMTNFYNTSGAALPPLLSTLVMQSASEISNMMLTSCRKCTVCSFEINSMPIISYLLNGSYGRHFWASVSRTANEFVVLIIMPGSPG